MNEFINSLDTVSQVLAAYIVIYGISFGFKNTWVRFKGIFLCGSFNQNDLGKLLDGVFYFSIILLWIKLN